MITELIKQTDPLCLAIEQAVEADDTASALAAACELMVHVSTLRQLTDTSLDAARQTSDLLDAAIDDLSALRTTLHERVNDAVTNGKHVTGFSLVPGRTTRRIDEAAALLALDGIVPESDLFERKFLGVPAIDKLLGKAGFKPERRSEIMADFVIESAGAPVLKKV